MMEPQLTSGGVNPVHITPLPSHAAQPPNAPDRTTSPCTCATLLPSSRCRSAAWAARRASSTRTCSNLQGGRGREVGGSPCMGTPQQTTGGGKPLHPGGSAHIPHCTLLGAPTPPGNIVEDGPASKLNCRGANRACNPDATQPGGVCSNAVPKLCKQPCTSLPAHLPPGPAGCAAAQAPGCAARTGALAAAAQPAAAPPLEPRPPPSPAGSLQVPREIYFPHLVSPHACLLCMCMRRFARTCVPRFRSASSSSCSAATRSLLAARWCSLAASLLSASPCAALASPCSWASRSALAASSERSRLAWGGGGSGVGRAGGP